MKRTQKGTANIPHIAAPIKGPWELQGKEIRRKKTFQPNDRRAVKRNGPRM
jgi:hypothetical protein